ncbi:MAG: cysteine peptidase family C39 domain-containing protein [Mycoplasmoidaceae bacterium]
MKIVQQTNEQECGVCTLVAIHNHIYNQFISKEQALEQSNISDNGMTIFDFEELGHKLGLECESYELNFAEFTNLKINSYFVLLLSVHGTNGHYVIARKKQKYIEIYDSCSSKMNKLSYSDLQKVFLNVLILVKKCPNKAFVKTFSKATTLLMFDLKFVLLNLGLSILLLALSVASASFLNYIIDLAIAKSSVNNLITICFIFILIYFCNDILTYVASLYMSRNVKNNFVLFTSKILSSLQTKLPIFLNKVDKNWIFKVDECVYNIANFCIVEINKFITNVIFCFVCICIIGSIQYYLLIFVFVYAVIEFIFFLFSYRKKQEVFMSIIRNENGNAQYYKNLINSLNNEVWLTKRRTLIDRIKNNYSNIYKNYSDVIIFKHNSLLFKSLLKSLCEICVIGLMSYLVIKQNDLSIGKLTFVISAFALYKNSASGISDYFLYKLEFNVYWQVYQDLTIVSNAKENKTFKLEESIKSICFIDEDVKTQLLINKNNLISKPVIDLLKHSNKILINNRNIELSKNFWESIIVLDQTCNADPHLLIKQIENNPELYSQYLRYFNIDLNKTNLSFYDSLIINFLTLISEKDKLIFIDDVMSCIKSKDMVVIKQIINKVRKNNIVIVTGKEKYD